MRRARAAEDVATAQLARERQVGEPSGWTDPAGPLPPCEHGPRAPRGTAPASLVCYNKIPMRDCAQCGHELEPFFDSTCEPPVAWLCQACASVILEDDLRSLSQTARRELGALHSLK